MTMTRGDVAVARRDELLFEFGDGRGLFGMGAQRARMRDEIDLGLNLDIGVAVKLLYGAPPVSFCSRLMQPKPRLSVKNDGERHAAHDGGRQFGIGHHVGAVADEADHLLVRRGELGAHGAGDLVAHAGIAVFHVIAALGCARHSTCRWPGMVPAAHMATVFAVA